MSSFSATKSRMILMPSERNPAVSSAFIVCSTSAMVLVMSTGHRSRVSPSRWIDKPLTVLYANDDLSLVEYGAAD